MQIDASDAIWHRINKLREQMRLHGVDAYIVASADPHMSEYLPEHWQIRRWLSGFTGSVGTLVITSNHAGLWVDGRYWVQAAQQLAGSPIDLQKQTADPKSGYIEWLSQHLPLDSTIAMNGEVISAQIYKQLISRFNQDYTIRSNLDLVSPIWPDRPALPTAKIYTLPNHAISASRKNKIAKISQLLADKGYEHHFISALDDIAWILNLRGADVEYNPVFLAHLYIHMSGHCTLFINQDKLNHEILASLNQDDIQILPYEQSIGFLNQLEMGQLLLDPTKVSIAHVQACNEFIQVLEDINPSSLLKAQKTALEIELIRQTMLQDGIALVEFFAWLDQAIKNHESLDELIIDQRLSEYRKQQPGFIGLSFATIAGFNQNGALPHYRATADAFAQIQGQGLLLIDSGGQYQTGTTDITRVVPVGVPSKQQRQDYTLVLKAHIALAETVFPEGIAAPLLDAIARKELWQAQLDYRHGTGHGVGFALNVHEGPQVLSYYAPIGAYSGMQAGMITSNEPGLYREGQWGIRLENLIVNMPMPQPLEHGRFLYFETLTLCPFDYRCIELELLSEKERAWLNHYHHRVWEKLSGHVSTHAKLWLEKMTQTLA